MRLLQPPLIDLRRYLGSAIALLILLTWAFSLKTALCLPISTLHPVCLIVIILWQTWLYVGLFITAHDAMHGSILKDAPRVNNWIGSFLLTLYGLLSYRKLLKLHWRHHYFPASQRDPDFHDGIHQGLIAWYFRFMCRYWSGWQFVGLAIIYHSLHSLMRISELNLVLFWVFPSLLSSGQLFYFGTYLPHQEPETGYQNSFRSRSIYRSFIWSLIACYHFGYHEEHHRSPHTPWWKLPSIAKLYRGQKLN